MKNTFSILFLSFFFISCQQTITKEDISKLNGYWEIEKVIFEDGDDKDFKVNENFDYIEVGHNSLGLRKKVKPQLDGTFIVNDSQENFEIRFENDQVFLDYNTSYAKWSEELIEITNDKMVYINAEKKEYHYKKATSINLLGDDKKTK